MKLGFGRTDVGSMIVLAVFEPEYGTGLSG